MMEFIKYECQSILSVSKVSNVSYLRKQREPFMEFEPTPA